MTEPRERELKFRFRCREGFLRAAESARLGLPLRVDHLENHYFDTEDHRLVSSRVMLRLRAGESFVLGLKVGSEPRPGYFDSLELETELSREVATKLLREPPAIYG